MPKMKPCKEAIQEIRGMVHDYPGAKVRCTMYPRKRPSFLKQMGVNLKDYESTGYIDYDTDLAKRIHREDAEYIEQYAEDMHTVWVLEHGIAAIPDETTRSIAEDTLLKRQRCVDLMEKYKMAERTVRWHKLKALKIVSNFI